MTERYSTFTLKIKALSDLTTIETYTNAPVWGVVGRQGLNAAEEGSFQFYASEADLLSDIVSNIGQVVTVYVTDQVASGAKMDMATFVIKKINTTTDDGVSAVTVSGPEITDQLRNTNAGNSAIDNGAGGVSTTDIDDIMNFASPGWSLTNETATADGTYHAAKGDTVLTLLNAAAQQSGEIFRLATYVDPSSKGLYWAASPDSSGVTLRMPTSYSQYNGSTTTGKLYSLRREFDFEPVITRIRPYGAGLADGRLDITGITSSNTGADPSWLDTTFASNLMVNSTLETSLGYVIAQDIDFSWIQASDPTNATQMTTAAVALWKTGKNYLEQNDSERKFYTAVCNVAANIRPGQNVTLVYAEYEGGPSGGTQTINDNLTLTVLSVENTFEEGERITTLLLGDKPLPQPTAASWVADVAERTQATTRKSDVGTSPGSVSTGRTINATQPVRIDGGAAADLSADRTLSINGLSTVGSANQIPGTNAGGTAWEYKTVTPGTGISIGHSAGAITITNSSPGSSLAGLAYVTIGNDASLSAERALTAGDGLDLTDGGANSTVTLAVDVTDFIDTSFGLTESSNNIRVNLAATSGLSFSTGALQLDDTVAGAGLTIASKVLAVGAGDGIDVAADSMAVDVTDIIGNGLVEVATNNIALGTPSDLTASSTNAVTTTSHTHAIDSTIARSAITITAGAGLTGGGNLTANRTIDIATADTSMTINADSIQVRLAATSGLQVSAGLMIADTVAGSGLTISSKVLAVGAGDGIDVAADSVAVDVTDIVGSGLVEEATNNLALGTPSSLTATSTNAVTTTSHTHAIDSTIARSAITISAGNGLTGGGDLTANRTIDVAAADTSMTINADSIQVRLAATSGLQISTGLMIADTIAGAGLTIASKVLAVGAGYGITVSADSVAVDTSVIAEVSDLHSAVTLAADADTLLGLSGQQITLDTQTANRIFAGPTSGSAADPTFRALVAADMPDPYSVRAYRSTDQTIGNATFTTINFDSTRWDNNSFFSGANPGRVTAQVSGFYLVTGHIRFDGNSTGERVIKLRANTTDIAFQEVNANGNSAPLEISIATVYNFSAGDYAQIQVYQSSGGNLDVLTGGNFSAEITMTKL